MHLMAILDPEREISRRYKHKIHDFSSRLCVVLEFSFFSLVSEGY